MDRRWAIAWSGAGLAAGWLVRVPDAPVPERVVRWVQTPGVRTEREVQRPDPASAACLDQRVAALALLGVKTDVPQEVPATELGCRAQLDLAAAIATERQLERDGRPQPFLPDTPDAYRAAAVTAVARAVVETCPELGLTLRNVDCAEYPCMAWFVGGPGAGDPTSCPAWNDAYGEVAATSSDTLIGPDGQRLRLQGVGPVEPSRIEPPPTFADPEEQLACRRGEHTRRLTTRKRTERDAVVDQLGAREETEAEQRTDQLAFWQRAADAGDEGAAQMIEALEAQWAQADAANP